MSSAILTIATSATVGSRKSQEDACDFRFLGGPNLPGVGAIVALADGMGGHAGGATASRTACRIFLSEYLLSRGSTRERLSRALTAANNDLQRINTKQPELRGMGCTFVAAALADGLMSWISVGDSVLYLVRDGQIRRLNEDHSMVPVLNRLVQQGEMSAFEAQRHPQRNALRSALTGDPIPVIDLPEKATAFHPGDWMILCSDGLLTLSERETLDLLRYFAPKGVRAVADALISGVEKKCAPRQDNATVIVARLA